MEVHTFARGYRVRQRVLPFDLPTEGDWIVLEVETQPRWYAGWVAELEDRDGGLVRRYLTPVHAELSRRGNGYKYYLIPADTDQVYEVSYVYRSMHADRAYIAVRDGTLVLLGTRENDGMRAEDAL